MLRPAPPLLILPMTTCVLILPAAGASQPVKCAAQEIVCEPTSAAVHDATSVSAWHHRMNSSRVLCQVPPTLNRRRRTPRRPVRLQRRVVEIETRLPLGVGGTSLGRSVIRTASLFDHQGVAGLDVAG